jgi:hypothetical protein
MVCVLKGREKNPGQLGTLRPEEGRRESSWVFFLPHLSQTWSRGRGNAGLLIGTGPKAQESLLSSQQLRQRTLGQHPHPSTFCTPPSPQQQRPGGDSRLSQGTQLPCWGGAGEDHIRDGNLCSHWPATRAFPGFQRGLVGNLDFYFHPEEMTPPISLLEHCQ